MDINEFILSQMQPKTTAARKQRTTVQEHTRYCADPWSPCIDQAIEHARAKGINPLNCKKAVMREANRIHKATRLREFNN